MSDKREHVYLFGGPQGGRVILTNLTEEIIVEQMVRLWGGTICRQRLTYRLMPGNRTDNRTAVFVDEGPLIREGELHGTSVR